MILNNPYQSSNSQNYLVQKNASLIAAKSLSKEKAKIATGESWMQEIDSTSSRRDNPYTRNSSQQFLRTSNYTPQTYGQPLSGSRYMSINDADAWKR